MKNQKGISSLAIILIIIGAVVVIGGGVFAYQYYSTKIQPVVQTQQKQNVKPSITVILPTGLIPQNAEVTIVGNDFAPTGNIVSVGYGNNIPNYRSLNKEFALSSLDNGTKIAFVPEQYGIFGEAQAVGGGWLTVINPLTGLNSNSVNLQIVKALSDQTAGWKTYKNDKYGFEFKYPEKWYSDETGILYAPKDYALMEIHLDPKQINYSKKSPLVTIGVQNRSIESLGTNGAVEYIFGSQKAKILCNGSTCYILIGNGDKTIYAVTGADPRLDKNIETILSTFKFTK